ncbi:MAG: hypothetical protein QM640_01725 [Niabella sp.]
MSSLSNNYMMKLPFNAEAVYVSLLESGHPANNIKTWYRGGFKKSYNSDVDNIEVLEYEDNCTFELTLNRDGIYDKLPEGLFHQTKGNNRISSVQDAVDEHKQYKEEEKQARKFFAPLEQMLFSYWAATEETERQALYDIKNGRLNQSFYDFWNLSTALPATQTSRLLQLMPYLGFIKSDRQATAAALGYILNKEVSIQAGENFITEKITPKKLKDLRLGMDAVVGTTSQEQVPFWKCTVNNILDDELIQYEESAPIGKLLQRFTEIFVPIDTDILFEFVPVHNTQNETYENILGIGCYL